MGSGTPSASKLRDGRDLVRARKGYVALPELVDRALPERAEF